MNAFLSGFISIVLLFSFCFLISLVFYKILFNKKLFKKSKPKKNQSIYYIETEPPKKPKLQKQTIAIKGTLLSKKELDKITHNDE